SLDLQATPYSYIERANTVLVSLVDKCLKDVKERPKVLDIGCGCGGNARAVRALRPDAILYGIEPNPRAAELSSEIFDHLHRGDTQSWLAQTQSEKFDAVILSDVLEHVADPMAFLRALTAHAGVRDARWVISVPNYAVWYNRIRTVLGRFEYTWSGLYDRTHLRFYTRRSVQKLLRECGFRIVEDRCTPSLVQSAAPVLRKFFEKDVSDGNHLAISESPAFRVYGKAVEPFETAFCQVWPELLGFQIVTVAALASG
ncbi:MAG TPA: class I SAM-dependent methyltransferase, partial [Polyangiaceae bacterium]|nr:class I SAM-dependent methyltransferase [Polyangiaceae bacterium]